MEKWNRIFKTPAGHVQYNHIFKIIRRPPQRCTLKARIYFSIATVKCIDLP